MKPIAVEKASGLVPLKSEQTSELEKRVETFVDDLVAQDANSPEFGKRVDALTSLGRREIAEAADQPVHLFLHVKATENWAEDKEIYEEMGLDWVG